MTPRARLAALFACLCLVVPAAMNAAVVHARLDRVADGDSMWVRDERGRRYEVRVIGIDAPERRQPFADEARDSLRRLLEGCRLSLHIVKPDSNERLLARVACNGVDAGLHQISSGLAWVYPWERAVPDSQRRQYAGAEAAARKARKGLWRAPQAVPPWEFRREQRGRRYRR